MLKKLLLITIIAFSLNASQFNLEKIDKEVKVQCTDLGIEALNYSSEMEKQKEFILTEGKNYLQNFSYLNDEKFVTQYIYGQCIEVALEYTKENSK